MATRLPIKRYATSELLQGCEVRFTGKTCGHVWHRDFSKGPITRQIRSRAMLERMVNYWNDTGGSQGVCPECTRHGPRVPAAAAKAHWNRGKR